MFYGTVQVSVSDMRAYEVCPAPSWLSRGKTANIRWRSCSLACVQSHKVYCAPKATSANGVPAGTSASNANAPLQNGDHSHDAAETTEKHQKQISSAAIASSPELKELLSHHPQLRDQLHEIYRSTLEDEWVEYYTPPTRGRGHGRGGKTQSRRSRGPWTAEKGFNRGLGRVRKMRQNCEDGSETGRNAEAFMQFLALVNGQASQE